jgi:hypothetical protein
MAIGDRLQAPSYLSRVDHHWKIRARKQRTDIGKYYVVNRFITDWNQLPEGTNGTSHGKTRIFKTRVREVHNSRGSVAKCCSVVMVLVIRCPTLLEDI